MSLSILKLRKTKSRPYSQISKKTTSLSKSKVAKPLQSSPQNGLTKLGLKKMKPRSAKAKGRKLQNWVADYLISLLPKLTPLDVRSTPMGSNGVDVQLSTAAYNMFPYDIECKNTERTKTIYNYYEQATNHDTGGEPLVIIKMNRQKPLAIVDAEHFMRLSCKKIKNSH